jgi:hypothetical protein
MGGAAACGLRLIANMNYCLDANFFPSDCCAAKETHMKTKQWTGLRNLGFVAAVLILLGAAGTSAKANPQKLVLVAPSQLPELAQRSGQAMLLHPSGDGRVFLYIEQGHGTQLAIFDVTDPSKIKEEGQVSLVVPGSYDFVLGMGDSAELIQFRNGKGAAVLDLKKLKSPTIRLIDGLRQPGSTKRLGDAGFLLLNQPVPVVGSLPTDYQVVETANPLEPNRLARVKQVRQELNNEDTGTTYLLTPTGLYIVRRPDVEEEYKIHEQQMDSN